MQTLWHEMGVFTHGEMLFNRCAKGFSPLFFRIFFLGKNHFESCKINFQSFKKYFETLENIFKTFKIFFDSRLFSVWQGEKSNLPPSDVGRDGVDRKNGDAPLMGASLLHINNE